MKRVLIIMLAVGITTDVQAKMMTWHDVKARAIQANQTVQQYVKQHQKKLVAAGLAAATVAAVAAGGAVAYNKAQKEDLAATPLDVRAEHRGGPRTYEETVNQAISDMKKVRYDDEIGTLDAIYNALLPEIQEAVLDKYLELAETLRYQRSVIPTREY